MDEKIISGIIQKDEQTIRQMVHEYEDYVYSIVMRIVKRRELAEEVTQDTFLKVISKIDSFNRKSKFSTWLFTIAYRTALNAVNRIRNEISLDQLPEAEQPDSITDYDDFRKERQRILWQGIDKLKTEQGVAVSLFYLQQFSIAEIAGIMNIPQNTVKSLMFRGRMKLKNHLLTKYEVEDLV